MLCIKNEEMHHPKRIGITQITSPIFKPAPENKWTNQIDAGGTLVLRWICAWCYSSFSAADGAYIMSVGHSSQLFLAPTWFEIRVGRALFICLIMQQSLARLGWATVLYELGGNFLHGTILCMEMSAGYRFGAISFWVGVKIFIAMHSPGYTQHNSLGWDIQIKCKCLENLERQLCEQ